MRSVQNVVLVAVALLIGVADAAAPLLSVPAAGVGTIRALVSKTGAERTHDELQVDMEALDWASVKSTKRKKVDAETQKVQRQVTAQLSVDQLLVFLDDVDRAGTELSQTDFMPRCLAHVEKVIKMINVAYGNEQLQQVVADECLQNEDYPMAHADSFNKKQACQSLVDDLAKLRDQELKTGSRKGYFNFCSTYVHNKDEDGLVAPYAVMNNGAKREAHISAASGDEDKESHDTPSWPFILLTCLACLCIVGAAFFTLRQQK